VLPIALGIGAQGPLLSHAHARYGLG
jgi:hypothetical protein